MLPAAVMLLLFLTYPLGLGVWLGMTDVKIGRPGRFVGLANFSWLFADSVFWLSVFNTFLYTVVASIIKFALGLWLALILNKHLPFKALLPGGNLAAVHRADGSLRDGFLVDLRRPGLDH